ncbi:MAG: DUF427 domain-containing protein [Xanthomonadales bacterium]|nr:DUF427 domain-containing protein [Xanthomonadales bacterium]
MSGWLKNAFGDQESDAGDGAGEVVRAVWNGQVIAESDQTVVVEGNHYFPADSVRSEFLQDSDTTTHCSWKGMANYYSLEVDGQTNKDAAWYYREPKSAASAIKDRIAFWRGVEVSKDRQSSPPAPSS